MHLTTEGGSSSTLKAAPTMQKNQAGDLPIFKIWNDCQQLFIEWIIWLEKQFVFSIYVRTEFNQAILRGGFEINQWRIFRF